MSQDYKGIRNMKRINRKKLLMWIMSAMVTAFILTAAIFALEEPAYAASPEEITEPYDADLYDEQTYASEASEPADITEISDTVSPDADGQTHVAKFYVDGTEIYWTQVTHGETVSAPTVNEREGYTFDGWYLSAECTGDKYAFSTPVNADITLYGKYRGIEYTITFDCDGGPSMSPIKVACGDQITVPQPTEWEGFRFDGWDPELPGVMPARDLSVKAKWTDLRHTVTFDYWGYADVPDEERIIKVADGKYITEPSHPTLTGFTFDGWFVTGEEKPFDFANTPVKSDLYMVCSYTWIGDAETLFYVSFDEVSFDKEGSLTGMYYNNTEKRYEQAYCGKPIKPAVKVTGNGYRLTEGVDYTVKYSDNKNAGDGLNAKVTITGKGNFKGTKTIRFAIVPLDIGKAYEQDLIDLSNTKVVKGDLFSPVLVTYFGYKLTDKDFVSDLSVPVKVDSVANIKGIGNYTGFIRKVPVNVVSGADITRKTIKVKLKADKHVYDPFGDESANRLSVTTHKKEGELTVTDAWGELLTENEDFELLYSNPEASAGTRRVYIIGIGKYSGAAIVEKSYKIQPDKTTPVTVSTSEEIDFRGDATVPYDGDTVVTAVSPIDSSQTAVLKEGVDYTLKYSSCNKAGTAKMTVSFLGNYKGRKAKTVTYKINKASFEMQAIAFVHDIVYTKPGKYQAEPFVTAFGTRLLKKNKDYKVEYFDEEGYLLKTVTLPDDTDSMQITAKFTGMGNFTSDVIEETYNITRLPEDAIDLSKAKIVQKGTGTAKAAGKAITDQIYEDFAFPEIDVRVKVDGRWITVDADKYLIHQGDNGLVGTATIWAEGNESDVIGYCKGKYKIVPRDIKKFIDDID